MGDGPVTEQRRDEIMRSWQRDILVGARALKARPTFTLIAILTLVLGIGATTAIWSVADTVLVKRLPYDHPEALVRLFSTVGEDLHPTDRSSTSYPDYWDWQRRTKTLAEIAGFVRWSFNLAGEGTPQQVWGGLVTANLFSTLKVRPLLGRTFEPAEDRPGGAKVALLSYELWRTLFAGAPDILGRKVRLDDVEHVIVGVMPPGFEFPSDAKIWVPLGFGPDTLPRDLRFLRLVARLAPGATLGASREEMSAIVRQLEKLYPETNAGYRVQVIPLHDYLVGDVRRAIVVLLAAAGLVLLIACVNVSNLLLSRFAERQSEFALRRALGASRGNLFQQFLVESLLLAAAGGAGGVWLAWVGVRVLVRLNLAQEHASFLADRLHDIPRLEQAGIDLRVLGFTLLVTLATALVVSLVPVSQLSEDGLSRALNEGGKGALGAGSGRRLRAAFVVAQVALALSLVIGAMLLIRSFVTLSRRDPGFRAAHLMTFQLSLPARQYADGAQTAAFYRTLLERLEGLPGVRAAGLTWGLPLSGIFGSVSFDIEGHPTAERVKNNAFVQLASPRYFETLGVEVRRGRNFSSGDTAESAPVVVINEAMARQYFPGEDPLGKHLTFDVLFGPAGRLPKLPRQIVGIVGDIRSIGLSAEAPAEMYFPYTQALWRMVSVAVRASGDPAGLAAPLRRQVWALDPNLSLTNLQPMARWVGQSVAQPRFNMILVAVFAVLAFALAGIGIYGMISYSVAQRAREIGIRMALGAGRRAVALQVMREGAALTALGLLLGTAGGFALTRLIAALLFGISPTDPWTFTLTPLLFLFVAQLACYLPTRRATRVDPLIALRSQ
jgi:putative ABC transport system permease protein